MNKKINLILPKKQFQIQRVGIYARVSTTDKDQLNSLMAQISALTRLTSHYSNWKLVDSQEDDTDIIISIMESLAQSENEQRSENIKWGLKQRAAQGKSKLYNRKCYGYDHDEN